jgi:hypothetical protein
MSQPAKQTRQVNTMTMSREEKLLIRKQQEEDREARLKQEMAETKERMLAEETIRMAQEAATARAVKNREVTPWSFLNLCELVDEASDKGDVIEVNGTPFPIRTITTGYPEARSRKAVAFGDRQTFKIEVMKKGQGSWSIGIVLDNSLQPGEYWNCGGGTVNKVWRVSTKLIELLPLGALIGHLGKVWYMNTRHGNMYNGHKLVHAQVPPSAASGQRVPPRHR